MIGQDTPGIQNRTSCLRQVLQKFNALLAQHWMFTKPGIALMRADGDEEGETLTVLDSR